MMSWADYYRTPHLLSLFDEECSRPEVALIKAQALRTFGLLALPRPIPAPGTVYGWIVGENPVWELVWDTHGPSDYTVLALRAKPGTPAFYDCLIPIGMTALIEQFPQRFGYIAIGDLVGVYQVRSGRILPYQPVGYSPPRESW